MCCGTTGACLDVTLPLHHRLHRHRRRLHRVALDRSLGLGDETLLSSLPDVQPPDAHLRRRRRVDSPTRGDGSEEHEDAPQGEAAHRGGFELRIGRLQLAPADAVTVETPAVDEHAVGIEEQIACACLHRHHQVRDGERAEEQTRRRRERRHERLACLHADVGRAAEHGESREERHRGTRRAPRRGGADLQRKTRERRRRR